MRRRGAGGVVGREEAARDDVPAHGVQRLKAELEALEMRAWSCSGSRKLPE